MYNPERFIKNNGITLKENCASKEINENVLTDLRNIKVALESQFLDEAKKVFKKYNVNTKNVTFIVESYKIADIDLYDEWMHKSCS